MAKKKKQRIEALERCVLAAMKYRPLPTDPFQIVVSQLCPDLQREFQEKKDQ